MKKSNIGGSRHWFNEVIAHTWSTAYSGIVYRNMALRIRQSGGLYRKYFESQKLLP